jgi:Na+/melibiose symporter-like transporter
MPEETRGELTRGQLAAYAAPAMALAVPTIPVAVMLPTFYAENFGLPLAAIGGVLAAARLLDVITDPLAGYVSDRWQTRFGCRKPMIAAGAPVAGIALYMLFVPPDQAGIGYLALWASLLYLGWTMISLPYTAWGAELSPSYEERSRITLLREGAQMSGILIAAMIPVLYGSGEWREGLFLIVLVTLAGGATALTVALGTVPDRSHHSGRQSTRTIRESARIITGNRPFLRLLAAWLLNGLANGLPMVLFAFFVTHRLGGTEADRNWLLLVYFGAGVAGIPFWLWLSGREQKHRVWTAAMVFNCIAFLFAAFLGEGYILAFAVICIATGLALGADLALPPAIQADVVDFDSLRSGRRRAGLYFAFWNMATKFALAIAVLLGFGLLDIAGFNADRQEQTETAVNMLVFTYAVLPIFLKSAAIALIYRFPIDAARQAVIRRRLTQLEHRNENGAEKDHRGHSRSAGR